MRAVLSETPLRPDTGRILNLEGDHVVVTYAWFEANERQLRHLTEATLIAERAAKARDDEVASLHERIAALRAELDAAQTDARHWRNEAARLLRELNTPETMQFLAGALREAAHQRERWVGEGEAHKAPEDWFWLVGYLAGKVLRYRAVAVATREAADLLPEGSGERAYLGEQARKADEKSIHHIVTTAAALANWHLNATGTDTRMRAGKPLAIAFQAEEEPEAVPLVHERRSVVESAGL